MLCYTGSRKAGAPVGGDERGETSMMDGERVGERDGMMASRRLRLALAQINTTVGDLAGNVTRILDAAHAAHKAGATVV